MGEEWLPVVGYGGLYEVSSGGRVRSLRRSTKLLMTPTPSEKGYLRVELRKSGSRSCRRVHSLVLEAFVGPCPTGSQCAHDDGEPSNNCLDNLSWKTPKDNQADRLRHGTPNRGMRAPGRKLSEDDVREIRRLKQSGLVQKDIARQFSVSQPAISEIVHRKAWWYVN